MGRLGIGVIGCGKVAGGHIRGWLRRENRAEVVALCDIVPKFCEEWREKLKLGDVPVLADYRELLKLPRVEAVDICSHSDTHSEIIRASLEAGKHVLTEKPAGYDLEDCRLLRWYAREYRHLKMAVAYSLRYYPVNIAAKGLIDGGAIGRPMYAQVVHNHPHDMSRGLDRPRRPRSQSDKGGRYILGSDMTPTTHVFDFCRYILGEVKDVFAFRERYGTFVMMRFESGALAQAVSASASEDGVSCPNVLTVQGTKGVLCTFNEPKKSADVTPRYRGYYRNASGHHEIEVETHDTGHGDYTRCENFLDAVLDGAPLIAPLEDAIRTSELLHAIKDSHDHEIRVPVHWRGKTG